MSEPLERPTEFKHLIAELFSCLGFNKVKIDHVYYGALGHDYDIDILYGVLGNATVAEVKCYRIDSPPRNDLVMAALQSVRSLKSNTGAKNCALIMSCQLTVTTASLVSAYGDVDVWDLGRIFSAAQAFPDVFRRLAVSLEIDVNKAASYVGSSIAVVHDDGQPYKRGLVLAEIIKNIPSGREKFRDYEDACIHSLKYLFDQDLTGWHEQHQTHDGHHRRDLVCRALPNAELWRLILSDLKSRYVVFEFKNYSYEIKETEISQAEKYLYPVALRCVAFIISPTGFSTAALAATHGAMRESGKMIISISSKELIQMLIGKDEGADPNVIMFKIVDELLMGLGR
ncbi:restriction endonuclease [Pseudomonas viciae]|uniref:restriction endonuclease n=1 Tax=Pseudomonas viciae TaxID=2505979 RepID=UPI00223420AF|nr:hypothetical protein [Pseudomonas viciae]UZE86593.1 hypothetical protein LOY66_00390 [Pseudomonas viciae]